MLRRLVLGVNPHPNLRPAESRVSGLLPLPQGYRLPTGRGFGFGLTSATFLTDYECPCRGREPR